jgi:methyltransferase
MVDSRWLFTALIALVGLERLLELRLASRNRRWLLARGAVEVGQSHYPWMVMLHSTLLLAAPMEVWFLERPLIPPLALAMMLLLMVAMALRYWVVVTLGHRWTTRVLLLPKESRITTGPFRFLDHPNYLAVVLEIAALPLVHTAWLTALSYSILNAGLLRTRIRVEETALREEAEVLE